MQIRKCLNFHPVSTYRTLQHQLVFVKLSRASRSTAFFCLALSFRRFLVPSCSTVPVQSLRMRIPTLFRSALAIAAVAAALIDPPQVARGERPIIVTKTITPVVVSIGEAPFIPEFVEVTTVGLTTVTVFGNDSSSTETTVTYTPPASGSETVTSQTIGTQAAGSQPAGSPPVGSQSVGSQSTGSQDPGRLSVVVTANATFLTDGPVNMTLAAVSSPTAVSETSTTTAAEPTAATLVATTLPASITSSKSNAAVTCNW